MYLTDDETQEEEINPHTFIDPMVGIYMAEDMRDAFIEIDPDNEAYYEERADEYLDRLQAIHEDYEERLRSEEHTSELQSRGHLVCRLLLEKINSMNMFHYVNYV